jgi:hypothetical protein
MTGVVGMVGVHIHLALWFRCLNNVPNGVVTEVRDALKVWTLRYFGGYLPEISQPVGEKIWAFQLILKRVFLTKRIWHTGFFRVRVTVTFER